MEEKTDGVGVTIEEVEKANAQKVWSEAVANGGSRGRTEPQTKVTLSTCINFFNKVSFFMKVRKNKEHFLTFNKK